MHEPVSPEGLRKFTICFHISLVGCVVLGMFWLLHTDYTLYYAVYWSEFLDGQMTFVYPIGFLVFFSGLFKVHFLLPKLVFLTFHAITSYQLFRWFSRRGQIGKRDLFACVSCLFNPVLCLTAVFSGLFDTVIEFLVFNFVLLLESKKGNAFLKDAVGILLIGLIISIKFVGVVILVPFLISGRKTMLRRLLIVACGLLLVVAALVVLRIPLLSLIKPFLEHAGRRMYTIFDGLATLFDGIENPPFILWFSEAYAMIAVPVTVIAVVSVDVFCFVKRVKFRTRVLLSIMVFLTFFQVSNSQFYLWNLPLFIIAYHEHTPTKNALQRKMAYHQGFLVLLSFANPFAQFLQLFFIHDLLKRELGTAKGTGIIPPGDLSLPPPSPAEAHHRSTP